MISTIEPPEQKRWKVGTLVYTSGGLVALFIWLLFGDFAWSMRDRSVGPMAHWYLKQLGVSNLLFGILVSSFPALVGLILGPIVSMKSDRHRGKWGRRIPFLLVTTPIAALGMIGLALTPFLAKWVHGVLDKGHPLGDWMQRAFENNATGVWFLAQMRDEVVIAILCFGVFWAAFEFATIAGQAVFGGLINDVVPKELLGRFYGLFRAVSLIDGIIFNYWIIGHVPTHFTLILCCIGVFYGVAFTWVCLKVKEGDYPPPPEEAPVSRRRWGTSAAALTRTYFKECFSNSYYISIFVMLTTGAVAFLPVNAFSIPYARSVNMDMAFYGKCLSLTFLISLCLSYFLGWLADIFHPIRMSMVALVGYLFVTAWGWTYATTANSFAIAFVAHAVASGVYVTSVASLGQRLYPHSRYAQFASAGGILMSVCTMGISPIMGIVIDTSGAVYQYTFLAGGMIALLALVASFYAYGRFVKLGGVKNYVAPES